MNNAVVIELLLPHTPNLPKILELYAKDFSMQATTQIQAHLDRADLASSAAPERPTTPSPIVPKSPPRRSRV